MQPKHCMRMKDSLRKAKGGDIVVLAEDTGARTGWISSIEVGLTGVIAPPPLYGNTEKRVAGGSVP